MNPSSEHHHHQEIASQTLERLLVCTKAQQEKKPRPPEQALNCPRCDSTNTKFCYYNNYSLSQPRYFCKSCRRYWTKGGTLRNVPVGGGCRKNKRSSSSTKRSQDDQPLNNNPNQLISHLTPLSYDCNDLSLAFARLQNQTTGQLGFDDHEYDLSVVGNPNNSHFNILGSPSVNTSVASPPGLFDSFRTGFLETQDGYTECSRLPHGLERVKTPNSVHNLYYGIGSENCGLGGHASEEMAMPYEEMIGATTQTMVKQELCNGREGDNRVLWGFPWQLRGDGSMGNVDSGRQNWNGVGLSWHGGLLNNPLM